MPNETDDFDQSFFEQTARTIARFHSLPMPISTNFEEWERFLEMCKTDFPGSSKVLDGTYRDVLKADSDLDREGIECLIKFNFEALYRYFFGQGLAATKSPLVFAHVDSHRDNRIVQEKINPQTGKVEKKLYFIDLDFAMFQYRGMDLGIYFESFGQKEYRFGEGPLPDDKKIVEFLEIYRQECSKCLGEDYLEKEENSIERMLSEVKVFVLYSYFLSVWISLNAFLDPAIPRPEALKYIHGCFTRAKQFTEYKVILEKDGILPDIGIDFYFH